MEGIEKLVIQRVKAAGVLRPRDLDEDGVPREYLVGSGSERWVSR